MDQEFRNAERAEDFQKQFALLCRVDKHQEALALAKNHSIRVEVKIEYYYSYRYWRQNSGWYEVGRQKTFKELVLDVAKNTRWGYISRATELLEWDRDGQSTRGQLIKVPMLVLFGRAIPLPLNTGLLPIVILPLENLKGFLGAVTKHLPSEFRNCRKATLKTSNAEL